MFKRVFTYMAITVIVCILTAGSLLILFMVSFWKNDRLTALSDDALSLARSVLAIYEASYNTNIFEEDSDELRQVYLLESARADADMYIVSSEGDIVYCAEHLKPPGMRKEIRLDGDTDAELLQETIVSYPLTYATQTKLSFRDEDVFVSAAAIVTSDQQLYYILAVQDVSKAYLPYTTEFFRMFIMTSLLGVFVAFIGSLLASYRMTRPLKNMTAVTKLYAEGDFSERIETAATYSELGEFADAFNFMADNLERIEESRSAFVANTSHELKTPMTIISGFIDGILDGTIPPEDEEKYLRIVSDETKRLSSLVVAMLNMSKIEAGKLSLSLSRVSFSNLILTTMLGFEQAVEQKHIDIEGIDTLQEVYVWADETLLNQIVYNLVDNAVKFTPENGKITVRLSQTDGNAVFRIRNTGKGIPASDHDLIFERFYKVDKSRGLDSKSFGIGLYIVKSIIELHHGTITVDSEEDAYTEFTVTLPTEKPKDETAS